jgi:stage V sporulation protein R
MPPKNSERDLLLFIIEHGRLKLWQADILSMIREESYYFFPQKTTKIMNEGFASFIHTKGMTTYPGAMEISELIDYADHCSGTLAMHPGRMNPYKLGIELFRDIEYRWNKGQFGKEWETCDDFEVKDQWDTKANLGMQKVIHTMQNYNDINFIDTFFTEDFCRKNEYFTYGLDKQENNYVIISRDWREVKQEILSMLTNGGQPIIKVVDGNYDNKGYLLLEHQYEGLVLDRSYAKETLESIYSLWGRSVFLKTILGSDFGILGYDGKDHIIHT